MDKTDIAKFLIRENAGKLDRCDKPHRFQDRPGILNGAPLAPVYCEKCGEGIPAIAARWYNLGILHTSDLAQIEIDRLEKLMAKGAKLREYCSQMVSEFRKAVRTGAKNDIPEGSQIITISDTLLNQICDQLEILSAE